MAVQRVELPRLTAFRETAKQGGSMTDDLEGSETALSEVLAVLAALSFV